MEIERRIGAPEFVPPDFFLFPAPGARFERRIGAPEFLPPEFFFCFRRRATGRAIATPRIHRASHRNSSEPSGEPEKCPSPLQEGESGRGAAPATKW